MSNQCPYLQKVTNLWVLHLFWANFKTLKSQLIKSNSRLTEKSIELVDTQPAVQIKHEEPPFSDPNNNNAHVPSKQVINYYIVVPFAFLESKKANKGTKNCTS
jgi:hypothetical protein